MTEFTLGRAVCDDCQRFVQCVSAGGTALCRECLPTMRDALQEVVVLRAKVEELERKCDGLATELSEALEEQLAEVESEADDLDARRGALDEALAKCM